MKRKLSTKKEIENFGPCKKNPSNFTHKIFSNFRKFQPLTWINFKSIFEQRKWSASFQWKKKSKISTHVKNPSSFTYNIFSNFRKFQPLTLIKFKSIFEQRKWSASYPRKKKSRISTHVKKSIQLHSQNFLKFLQISTFDLN